MSTVNVKLILQGSYGLDDLFINFAQGRQCFHP